MQQRSGGVITEAVLFIDDRRVIKEMLYPEFEAVLDQVVGIPEFAGRELRAAYLHINERLRIQGVVLFQIDFDRRGYADQHWNVPLRALVENAGRGPDLGGGRIRLSCRSQCSISWQQQNLWDPVIEGPRENHTLNMLAKAVRQNRLGIAAELVDEDEPARPEELPVLDAVVPKEQALSKAAQKELIDKLTRQFQQEHRERVTALKEEFKLRAAALKSEAQDAIDKLHKRYRSELSKHGESSAALQQQLQEAERRNRELHQRLEAQAREFQQVRERAQSDAQNARVVDEVKLQELHQQFEVELKARLETATAELKEMLDMREVELYYREEQIGGLREEVSRLRQERENLTGGSAVLKQLNRSGVTFVAYHPGPGHLTIPLNEISHYLEDTVGYVADKCAVSSGLYQQWLAHYELPVCGARLPGGDTCGEPVAKVEKPGQFEPGESDRCARHRADANNDALLEETP